MIRKNLITKYLLLSLLIFAFIGVVGGYNKVSGQTANSCLNNVCRLSPNSNLIINAHGEAWLVENTDPSKEIFIPIQSATEWAQFRLHYPAHIVLAVPYDDCTLPWGGTLAHGDSVMAYKVKTAYGCCSESISRTCNDGTLEGDSSYNQASCTGDTFSYNYNGSSWQFSCVEKDGLVWMDRNLGATAVCTSGRAADGHQIRTSGTTATLSSSDTPGHSNFITSTSGNYDWRDPQNTNLWQGETGVNNPCPSGWRVPTEAELNAERLSWSPNNSAGAYTSTLKWSVAGARGNLGSLASVGGGLVWGSAVSSANSRGLYFYSSGAGIGSYFRVRGGSVRCLRDFSHFGLTYSSTTGGSVSGETEQIVAVGASGSTVTAVPDEGYIFVQWSDGLTTETRTDTNVTEDISVVAEFEEIPFVCGDSVSFTYNGESVTYNTISRGGKCWLDRNLGATAVCTSSTHAACYGDLFQWGRAADGHQIRTSGTTSTRSSSDNPGHSNFITHTSSPYDWRRNRSK